LELALRAMNAAGAFTFGTLQTHADPARVRYQPERQEDGSLSDPAAFEAFLAGVRKTGAPRSRARLLPGGAGDVGWGEAGVGEAARCRKRTGGRVG
jgi:hypothetical protein